MFIDSQNDKIGAQLAGYAQLPISGKRMSRQAKKGTKGLTTVRVKLRKIADRAALIKPPSRSGRGSYKIIRVSTPLLSAQHRCDKIAFTTLTSVVSS